MAHRSARGQPPSASRLHHPPHAPWKPPAQVPIFARIQHDPRISARADGSEPQALPCATQRKSRQTQYESKIKKVHLRKSTETTRNQRNRSHSPKIHEINSGRYFDTPSPPKPLRKSWISDDQKPPRKKSSYSLIRNVRHPGAAVWPWWCLCSPRHEGGERFG